MGTLASRPLPLVAMEEAKKFVDSLLSTKKVVVISKSYCPYCKRAKDVLRGLPIAPNEMEVVEIENRPDCSAIQAYCKEITGASSVPRIFIAGKSIGGCDDLMALKNGGKLDGVLKEAGALQ